MACLQPGGVPQGLLQEALRSLAHRGPDGAGTWRQGPVGLAHTRLALSGGAPAAQPLVGPGWAGVVNGELYNHQELRALLREPVGPGDSAVLLAWLAQEGLPGLDRCRGAFAVLLWQGDQLLAVRDRFGIKPLYWTQDGDRLTLASEPAALLSAGHPARWNQAALGSMLSHQYLLPTQTVFDGVHALEPGCWLRARAGQPPKLGRWWSWRPEQQGPAPSTNALDEALQEAVAERCVADQPVATLLSGGLDSALVAAMARRHGVDTAYTVRFVGERGWDEGPGAAQVAAHLGMRHRVLSFSQAQLLEHFEPAVVASGGPVINTHAAAKWLLCQQVAADGHAVVLSGEGADELFWGYEHLIADAGGCALGSAATAGVHLPLGPTLDTSQIQAAWGSTPSFLAAKSSLAYRLAQVCDGDLASGFGPMLSALGDPPPGHPASRSAWAWSRLCLTGSILQRLCDPLEMAWGVEGRMPLLEHKLVQLAARVPAGTRVGGGQGKLPLRAVAARWLPPETAQRAKHPFMGPPLKLDADLRDRLLGRALPFVNRGRLERQLSALRGRSASERVPWDPVWLLLLSCQALAAEHGL